MLEKETFGKTFEKYSYGDLHVHTNYADKYLACDGTVAPERIIDLAEEQGHSFIAITDHDTIASSVQAKEYAAKQGYKVEVIVGAEISSSRGHILGLNLQDNIPFWLDSRETIRRIHKQGGLAIPAHPFYSLTSSLGEKGLREIAYEEDPEVYLDGIEAFNSGANDFRYSEWLKSRSDGNRRARDFYQRNRDEGLYGAAVGGSDTHTSRVGRAVTIIPHDVDIYTAIKMNKTGVVITDTREAYTPRAVYKIIMRSRALEHARLSLPAEQQVFPGPRLAA